VAEGGKKLPEKGKKFPNRRSQQRCRPNSVDLAKAMNC
jgi:hypothetical protein